MSKKLGFNIGSKVIEIDGTGKFCGKQFIIVKDTRRIKEGISRCVICGKWYNWKFQEPAHCGKEGCEYFWWLRLKHLNKVTKQNTKEREKFFNDPKVVKQLINKTKDFVKGGLV